MLKYLLLSLLAFIVSASSLARAQDSFQATKLNCLDKAFNQRSEVEKNIASDVWTYKADTSLYQLGARSTSGFCTKVVLIQLGVRIHSSLADIVNQQDENLGVRIGRDRLSTNMGDIWYSKIIVKSRLSDALLIANDPAIVAVSYPESRITTEQKTALKVLIAPSRY